MQIDYFMKIFGFENQKEITHIIIDAPRNGNLSPAALTSAIHNLKYLDCICEITVNLYLNPKKFDLNTSAPAIVCALANAEGKLPDDQILKVTGYMTTEKLSYLWWRKGKFGRMVRKRRGDE
jgi:5,10-methylene-tetrahydrofolate dehydrogenase/methenyl tetrahydrofolate cyclohydrolase